MPDKEKQEAMIQELKRMEIECENNEAVLLFCDAVHQLHNTCNGYCIQFKGKKYTKTLASNT